VEEHLTTDEGIEGLNPANCCPALGESGRETVYDHAKVSTKTLLEWS